MTSCPHDYSAECEACREARIRAEGAREATAQIVAWVNAGALNPHGFNVIIGIKERRLLSEALERGDHLKEKKA